MPKRLRTRVPELMAKRKMTASDLSRALVCGWPAAARLAAGELPRPQLLERLAIHFDTDRLLVLEDV